MKGLLFFGAFALLAFVSCKDIDVPYVPEETYDEAWYAANATISSSDAHFAVTEDGNGTISFKAEGGSVVVYVDCGTEWTAENSAADIFGCDVQNASITVTAEQNLVEEELYGTITLMTLPSQIHFATIAVTQNAYGAPEITVATNEWHAPAVAPTAEELTTEIGVEANVEWSIESDAEWLTAEKGGDSVILTVAENETTEERVAEVVLTCTDGYNSDSETITVTQDARAYITLSVEEFELDKAGGENEVTVESNYEWGYAYESDWFTVSESTDGSLTITAGANATGDDREGTVTFTAGDGAANTAVATLTITQKAFDPAALVLEYTITSDGTTIQLPIGKGTIDCIVDCGDGETETISSGWPSHTYSDAGTYYVSISGTVEWLNSGSVNSSGRECLTAVIQWGDLGLTDMGEAFGYCSNLASIPDGPGPFENVGDFSVAFLDCKSLTTVPVDIFSNCTSVVDFSGVFSGCTNLTVAPSFEGLSKVTYFDGIFCDCTSLTSLPENMFSGCTASFTFENAFQDCTSLTTVPVNIFSGCPSIILCRWTFSGCSSVSGESPYDEIMVDGETVKVHLYERENYPDYFSKPVETYWCFEDSTFSDIDDIPEEWK